MTLSISSGKRLCANRLCAIFCGSALRYDSIVSWVLYLICAFLLQVLWAGASSLLYFILYCSANSGDPCGVTGCYTLISGATIGGVSLYMLVGFGGSLVVGTRPSSGNTALNFCVSATGTFLVCFEGEI